MRFQGPAVDVETDIQAGVDVPERNARLRRDRVLGVAGARGALCECFSQRDFSVEQSEVSGARSCAGLEDPKLPAVGHPLLKGIFKSKAGPFERIADEQSA